MAVKGEGAPEASLCLKVYGVRGSHPVSGREFLVCGGHTTCYAVRARGHLIILDAGTGIIDLGNELVGAERKTELSIRSSLFISHTHHDHTQGLPFFKPLYLADSQLYLFGPRANYVEIEDALAQGLAAPFFPVSLNETPSMKSIRSLVGREEVCFFDAEPAPVLSENRADGESSPLPAIRVLVRYGEHHPKAGVLHFRIESGGVSIVYATDTEGVEGGDANLIDFARGADLLIHDAQYLPAEYASRTGGRRGYGHSTFEMACEAARKAGVRRLLLHHHDPERSDEEVQAIEREAQRLFPPTEAAREGMAYSLSRGA
ncbi:MAG: MBL fold metallo-hydrolase [Planctomycetota bacterium]